MPDTITDVRIKRHNGVAGQFSYTATYTINGEPSNLELVGSIYGGAPVLVMGNGAQVFVRNWQRFGFKFNPEYVRNFVNGVEVN